jgi:sugar phosphate isomerase/epimerase
MRTPELAVCLDDLGLEIKAALGRARSMGFSALDIGATSGPISPQTLSLSGRRHFLKHIADLGLRVASLRGPTGGPGYGDAGGGEHRLDTMRKIISLASSLRVPVVSTMLGPWNDERDATLAGRTLEALELIAGDADRQGVAVAIETVGVSTQALGERLRGIGCRHLTSCCDSGALIMQGESPYQLAESLAGRIGLVRARDAVAGTPDASGHEVAMGDGALDPPRFLASLMEAGFEGDIVLSRTTGTNPAADLLNARNQFAALL